MSGCVCSGTELQMISLFDGIAGFPLAFGRAGVRTVATVEIDKAAAGVAADHFPEAKAFTDITEVTADDILGTGFCPVHGVFSAGWPCTDLSLAGLRLGLGGARSGLVGEVFRLLLGVRPRWFVLENVPGLLSSVCPCPGGGVCSGRKSVSKDYYGSAEHAKHVPCDAAHPVRGGACGRRRGRGGKLTGAGRCMALHGGGMGTVLRRLVECGYGVSYRVLDAQHFGVPQRRRRVVIVGHLGDAAGPVEVLLEPARGGRDSAASRAAGTGVADSAERGTEVTGSGVSRVAPTLQGGGRRGYRIDAEMAAGGGLIPQPIAIQNSALTAGENVSAGSTGRGHGSEGDPMFTLDTTAPHAIAIPIVPVDLAQVTSSENRSNPKDGDPAGTLAATSRPAVAFGHKNGIDPQASAEATPTLRVGADRQGVAYALRRDPGGTGQGHNTNYVPGAAAVRRLTPVECERLQGYPDGWTATSHGREQSDSARYRQLGNSIAVPVFEWAARRLVEVDAAARAGGPT